MSVDAADQQVTGSAGVEQNPVVAGQEPSRQDTVEVVPQNQSDQQDGSEYENADHQRTSARPPSEGSRRQHWEDGDSRDQQSIQHFESIPARIGSLAIRPSSPGTGPGDSLRGVCGRMERETGLEPATGRRSAPLAATYSAAAPSTNAIPCHATTRSQRDSISRHRKPSSLPSIPRIPGPVEVYDRLRT